MEHASVMLVFVYLIVGCLMSGILLLSKPVFQSKPVMAIFMSLILILWLPLGVLSLMVAALTGKALHDPFI